MGTKDVRRQMQRVIALYILLNNSLSAAAYDEDWRRVAILAVRLHRVKAYWRVLGSAVLA